MSAARTAPSELSATKQALLAKWTGGAAASPSHAITAGDPTAAAPLSFSQLRVWFLEHLSPGEATYNIPIALRLRGPLDITALEQALCEVLRRHSVLRCALAVEDVEPVQRPVQGLGLTLEREACAEDALRATMRAEVRKPFAFSRPPLVRARLLGLGDREHVLVMTWHHAVADEWSGAILADELRTLYRAARRGETAQLPQLDVMYTDFARWQRAHLRGTRLEQEVQWWREALAGAPTVLDLPTDRPRPAASSTDGDVQTFRCSRALVEQVDALGRELGASPFMVCLTAFGALLNRISGQDDLLVGCPIAGRTRSEVEGLIGFFAGTLALRADLRDGPTFRAALQRMRQSTSAAYAHQDIPFDRVVEALAPARDLTRHPLFQVLFSWQDDPPATLELDGLDIERLQLHAGTAKFDLSLFLHRDADGAEGELEYATALFDRRTAQRLIDSFITLLEAATSDPDQLVADLPLMRPQERRTVLAEWNATDVAVAEDLRAHDLLHAQACATPDSVAIEQHGQALTYGELDARANQLAHGLQRLGVGPESLVGICVERSPQLLVAMLGVLKAGGAYLPLEDTHPDERLAFMLDDAAPAVIVSSKSHAERCGALASALAGAAPSLVILDAPGALDGERATAPNTDVGPENLAYVLYTSGSTGRPKGVAVEHRSVVNFLTTTARLPGVQAHDTVLAVSASSFDIAVYDLLTPLTVGARVVLASDAEVRDGSALLERLHECQATILDATPATWRMLLAAGWEGDPRCKAISTGEALAPELGAQIARRAGETWNLYGPTETTVWAAWHRVAGDERPMPIGRPTANARIYILDARLHPVPVGVTGELLIGGAGVARGYLGRPDLTAERFVPDPFGPASGRLYRTGDRARYRADATIEYLGRGDDQVKLRGHRIELGEVESVLREHAGVHDAAAAIEGEADDARLEAFVAVGASAPSTDALRAYVAQRLPAVMVPSRMVAVDELPLNANGKLDRGALRTVASRSGPAARQAGPSSSTERVVADIWARVLGVDHVNPKDGFFELGGHSVLALRAARELSEVAGVNVPVVLIFQYPTVVTLAAHLDAEVSSR